MICLIQKLHLPITAPKFISTVIIRIFHLVQETSTVRRMTFKSQCQNHVRTSRSWLRMIVVGHKTFLIPKSSVNLACRIWKIISDAKQPSHTDSPMLSDKCSTKEWTSLYPLVETLRNYSKDLPPKNPIWGIFKPSRTGIKWVNKEPENLFPEKSRTHLSSLQGENCLSRTWRKA